MTHDAIKTFAIIQLFALLFSVALLFAEEPPLTINDKAFLQSTAEPVFTLIPDSKQPLIGSANIGEGSFSFTLPTAMPVSAHNSPGATLGAGYGLAWKIDQSMAIDIGYRYLEYGKMDDGDLDFSAADGGLINLSPTGRAKEALDQTAHEVSLGLTVAIN